MEPDERDLAAGARAGDPDAWEALYRRLYPKLRAYLLRRVGPAQVEDTVSETMARAVRGIGRYRPGPSGVDGWVFGIARRVAADHHRKVGRQRRQDSYAAGQTGAVTEAEVGEPLAIVEDHDELRRAFALLGEPDQELLDLRVVAGLSVEQVSAVLGKSPGAVRTAQSRALDRLRRLMEVEGD